MKRKSVGYFDGIDSAVLSSLVCEGFDTIPISNGMDNYGKHVRLLNEETKVDILMGYLHKIYAPVEDETQAEDIIHICQTYQIPFFIVVPDGLHNCARKKFVNCPDVVRFVDPNDLLEMAREILRA